jgi:Sulfotransferase family
MPGSPFTGSTLLGLLLNEHPDIASIGAATGLIRDIDLSTYACACGRLFRDCEFWNAIAARTQALGHPVNIFETNFWNTLLRLSHNRVLNALLVRSLGSNAVNDVRDAVVGKSPAVKRAISTMGWNTWSLATAVLERTGKTVFVDTARDHQRPKYLVQHPLLDVRVIHLIRDPRGNSASIMKHSQVDAAGAARRWTHYNTEAARVKRYLPERSWMTLYYEDLCANPGAVLDQISDFLEVPRGMPQPRAHDPERHVIGNPMRLRALSEIREDRSWETQLSQSDLKTIAGIAGSASRALGYNWP